MNVLACCLSTATRQQCNTFLWLWGQNNLVATLLMMATCYLSVTHILYVLMSWLYYCTSFPSKTTHKVIDSLHMLSGAQRTNWPDSCHHRIERPGAERCLAWVAAFDEKPIIIILSLTFLFQPCDAILQQGICWMAMSTCGHINVLLLESS